MSILRRMATGATWMMGLRFFIRSVGFVSTIILARLLVPADFGLVAMATAIHALVITFSDLSAEAPLVQKETIDREDMDSAFSLKLVFALAQALLLALAAAPVAAFYDEPRLDAIILVLAAVVLLDATKNVGTVEFVRELRFHKEFILKAIPKVISFTFTVTFALLTHSYWALVLGIVVNALSHTILSYFLHAYRPRLSCKRWPEIFRFSRWMVINNALFFVHRRGADFVLGRLGGARSVGLFSVAYEIAMLPTTEMVAPLNRVAFPGYSRMDSTTNELRNGYVAVAGMAALVALPAGWGIALTAPLLVPLLLGEHWSEAIPLIGILGVSGGVQVLLANSGSIFMALGRPHVLTALFSLRAALLIGAMILGASTAGAYGVAIAYLVVTLLMLPLQLWYTFRTLALRTSGFVRAVYRPIVAATLMYAVLQFWLVPLLQSAEIWLSAATLLAVVSGAGIYTGTVALLWYAAGYPAGAESRTLSLLQERIAALRSGGSRKSRNDGNEEDT